MRVLCLGLDGADYDLVCELLAQGRLPTLARLSGEGTFGPLRSTIPAFTPTAWSSFLTGLNPAGHGIFAFTSNPNRGGGRLESAASRAGAPLWRYLGAAGIRSAFVTVPFTHPPEPLSGILVTGFGGPRRPEIVPLGARNAILTAHPDLRASRHPSDLQDFRAAAATLTAHVEEIADVCFLALELEPDLGLLCVDFMSSDIAGHLMWHRLDPTHPAHRPGEAGDELVQVYEAVDAACGYLIEQAEWLWDEQPTVFVLSDHGMKPTHWLFRANRWLEDAGYLSFRRDAAARTVTEQAAYAPELEDTLADEQPAFAEIDFGATRAYCFGYGGQIYLGEVTGAEEDRGLANELAEGLAEVTHPDSGEPAFDVRRKEELYRGFYLDRAPELVLLPRDERVHVDSTRQRWSETFQRHERLFARGTAHFSGQHAVTGILAAAGPGIGRATVPPASEITQIPATLLALHGLAAELDAPAIDTILDAEPREPRRQVAGVSQTPVEPSGYTREEEELIVRRLQDLGYE
ncbi:MAG TPA: alkaline phosphatase family protein [Gaiellaceae bacterium]|nr:alkaline phosphatase family protein [Gaiellaceae bacterium]